MTGIGLLVLASSALAADAPANPAPPPSPTTPAAASPAAPISASPSSLANIPAADSNALPNAPANIPANTIVLDALDKISGRVRTISGAVGQILTFGNLQIVARTCLTHPPEETPENSAFLEITQLQGKEPPKQVFSGWMFSSNPAISAMDNSIYDVWVLSCENKTASKAP